MNENTPCRDCELDELNALTTDRRAFLRRATAGIASLAAAGATTPAVVRAQTSAPAVAVKPASPAEDLVRELHSTLTDAQKQQVVLPWNHGAAANTLASRFRIYNAARGPRINTVYTAPQQELITRILRSMCSDEEGFRRIQGVIRSDSSGLGVGGADIFGDPTGNRPFTFVFSTHHLTLRCDGNSEPDTAFGGPLYYGHSLSGNNERNHFNFQTLAVRRVFDALSEDQRRRAVVTGTPGEGARSIEFRRAGQARPGLGVADISADQRRLIEQTMRDILAPFRREDTDEVMDLIRRNGGLDRINLAFYQEPQSQDQARWHFWRLEGPGFVWNYRILPHVHAYVNIGRQA